MTWLFLALWLFAVGAIVGSFLNVVVYRLPRGMSIIWPGSHCPACRWPIAWYDNIPVLSWFVLRGKCRHCRAPISARYPAVEALSGGLFLVVGLGELFSGIMNFLGQMALWPDVVIALQRPLPQLAATYLVDMFVLSTVLASALIEFDGQRPPGRLFAPAMVLAAVAPVVWPVHRLPEWFVLEGRWAAACDMLLGFGLGITLGLASVALRITVRRLAAKLDRAASDSATLTSIESSLTKSASAKSDSAKSPSITSALTNAAETAADRRLSNFDSRNQQVHHSARRLMADPYWLAAGCIGGRFGIAAALAICGAALIAICITAPLRRKSPPTGWLLAAAVLWIAVGLR